MLPYYSSTSHGWDVARLVPAEQPSTSTRRHFCRERHLVARWQTIAASESVWRESVGGVLRLRTAAMEDVEVGAGVMPAREACAVVGAMEWKSA